MEAMEELPVVVADCNANIIIAKAYCHQAFYLLHCRDEEVADHCNNDDLDTLSSTAVCSLSSHHRALRMLT